ncbi:glutathione S-transferase domain-containing protein [Fistulina hepatica ATCC 64428]|uniref:Glutathione S-transferase domain-containing protein n=1 Tax=Fistulina hepatica ATCC 64428 TaxID=1128425 RepID=A0A0D6ZYU6_9AGAR|nr:glutathione S-transferase domain-containing protein [Fistulina hepatica ATCC 64428]
MSTASNETEKPKIILYTSHTCPWAHRAHIALHALGLEFEEVIIDLDRPRDEWYLKVNPRGLVPTLSYNGAIIPESAIVATFLADAHPSLLLPPSTAPSGALTRARISFFADAYISKVQSVTRKLQDLTLSSASAAEISAQTTAVVDVLAKEIEPLLDGSKEGYPVADPFFLGSPHITLAEVLTGSFVLRLLDFPKPGVGILPEGLATAIAQRTPAYNAWAERVVKEKSVNYIWNAEEVAKRTKAKAGAKKAAGK